ncbi:hypothetical protein Enr17x_42690 [Gimesia fumaroli]|uniref:Uncharacterized protein n=1 Tax=Gimesia fumaroli TaxID=2527976 RepID=A0A518IGJ7_9PLAN|nr:hypothetical protein Enr17x_42690 [Gimesia fumaroli]
MWCERGLGVCLKGRRVDRTVLEMRRCVSTRITFEGFHLKNWSKTSVFLQVRLKPVSQIHLNQQCSRARRITGLSRVARGSQVENIQVIITDVCANDCG